ncbi:hypothetical protein PUATCC27989T_01841 [Phytobacter ursingii]|nr:hypothetical protein PUATCC27989T_01841 [Phytobacter ursingii]
MTLSARTGAPSYAEKQRTRYATATEICRWLTCLPARSMPRSK